MIDRVLRGILSVSLAVCLCFGTLTVHAEQIDENVIYAEEDPSDEDVEHAEASMDGSDGQDLQEGWPIAPSIQAQSGIVMEASQGIVLYSKNMTEPLYPASITKVLTALLAVENCDLDELVEVPMEAVYMADKGSHVSLDVGEKISVRDCLYSILLASANDAAYALACHIGGSIEGFAEMMNRRAVELGCTNSHFTNPHGLPDPEHISCAYDMALITRAALQYSIIREIGGTTYTELQPTETQPDVIPMANHHKMLTKTKYRYEGAFFGKTGYTTAALNTLITCASRNNTELIVVTMKTQGRQVYVDTASLFDWAFDSFSKKPLPIEADSSMNAMVLADNRKGIEGADSAIDFVPNVTQKGFLLLPEEVQTTSLKSALISDGTLPKGSETALRYYYEGRFVGGAMVRLPDSLAAKEVALDSEDVQETPADGEKEDEPVGYTLSRMDKLMLQIKSFHYTFVWWHAAILAGILLAVAIALLVMFRLRRIQSRWRGDDVDGMRYTVGVKRKKKKKRRKHRRQKKIIDRINKQ